MSVLSNRAGFEIEKTLAAASITGSYLPVGTPFTNAVRILRVYNQTDAVLVFSDDGVNDKFRLAAGLSYDPNITAARTESGNSLTLAAGSRMYVKLAGAAATTGVASVGGVIGVTI